MIRKRSPRPAPVPSRDPAPNSFAPSPVVEALAAEFATACRLTAALLDEDQEEGEVLSLLSSLATAPPRAVPRGRERAWVLRTLVTLLGAADGARRGAAALHLPPDAGLRRDVPWDGDLTEAAADREVVIEALADLDVPTRAAVLLVVREGLTLETAASVQGSSRRAFARRYASGVAQLGPDVLEALIGS